MSVIIVTVGLVFGAYLYQPLWFDSGPYTYVSSHEALADCEKAKMGNPDAICANGELYEKEGSVSKIEKSDSTDTTMKSHWNE